MQPLFHLASGAAIGREHTLLAVAGPDFCACAYYNKAAKSFDGLRYFSFDETEVESSVAQIISEAKESVGSAVVCSAFSQALLVPTKFFTGDYSLLDAVYSQPAQAYFHDAILEWQMTNVYAMPAAVQRVFQDSFATVAYFHVHTPTIKVYNGYAAGNQLMVDFTRRHFRVLFKKDAVVRLAQTYAYKTPLDVIYFLLKICREFGLLQSYVQLILSGLIEHDSALFSELRQYFSNLHFAQPPEISLPGDKYPHHYFTSLYNLASCAS